MNVDSGMLRAYLDDELSQAERDMVEKVLATSPTLQARLVDLAQDKENSKQILNNLSPGDVSAWSALRRFQRQLPEKDGLLVWESPSIMSDTKNNFKHLWRIMMQKPITVSSLSLIVILMALAVLFQVNQSPLSTLSPESAHSVEPIALKANTTGRILIQDEAGIYLINLDGTKTITLTEEGWSPRWSPDGTEILYLARYEDNNQLYRMTVDGTSVTHLTDNLEIPLDPAWSPDGESIAILQHKKLESNSSSYANNIYRLDADGTNLKQLTFDTTSEGEPIWSPDGQKIAFASHQNSLYSIYVMDADGSNEQNLTSSYELGMNWRPVWSPDGQQIAFVNKERESGLVALYIIDHNGYNLLRLTNHDASQMNNILKIAWASNNEWIAFTAQEGEQYALYKIKPDGSELTRVADISEEAQAITLDWSPNGKQVAYMNNGLVHIYDTSTETTYSLDRQFKDLFYLEWQPIESKVVVYNPIILTTTTPSLSLTETITDHLAFGYGIQIDPRGHALTNLKHLDTLNFGWAKFQMAWKDVEATEGHYNWELWDRLLETYQTGGIKVMLSVVKAPDWARPENDDKSIEGFPVEAEQYAQFVAKVAQRYSGQVQAIEIWDEQNMWYKVGGRGAINPAAYTELLQKAYQAIKIVNPEIIVISGGLTPAGNVGDLAIGDVSYLQQFYESGAKGYFDALGAHPGGFNCPAMADWQTVTPDEATANPKSGTFTNRHHSWCFLGTMEAYRAMMVTHDDGDTPIIITEFGWAVSENPLPGYEHARDNSPAEQAEWILEAYHWGYQQEWVGPMVLWNLNYKNTMPDTALSYFSILNTPTYDALVDRVE